MDERDLQEMAWLGFNLDALGGLSPQAEEAEEALQEMAEEAKEAFGLPDGLRLMLVPVVPGQPGMSAVYMDLHVKSSFGVDRREIVGKTREEIATLVKERVVAAYLQLIDFVSRPFPGHYPLPEPDEVVVFFRGDAIAGYVEDS